MLAVFKVAMLLNAALPMLVTVLGMVTLVNFMELKASLPMVVTDAGIVRLVSRVSLKALSPMVVTVLGIVMLVNPVSRKALSLMVVSEAGKLMLVREVQPMNILWGISWRLLGRVTLLSEELEANTPVPKFWILVGILAVLSADLPKALSPMVVTEFGIAIEVICAQSNAC